MAYGNGAFICAGIAKCITCSGCGIWFVVDIIRAALNTFEDGNGHKPYPI